MKLFLASTETRKALLEEAKQSPYILESFYYFEDWQTPLLKTAKKFLLDSGAFTFMAGGGPVDWDAYVRRYVDFINARGIKYFFELDIDSIEGYERVKTLRRVIESGTQRQCIPVWHKSRGTKEFLRLCDEYDYIAIGGFAIKEIKKQEYPMIPRLLNAAASKGTKVHGLGFTPADVQKYGFYSVDSSSWIAGGRYAAIYQFSGGTMRTIKKPEGKRVIDYLELDRHNMRQWIKYQKYLDRS